MQSDIFWAIFNLTIASLTVVCFTCIFCSIAGGNGFQAECQTEEKKPPLFLVGSFILEPDIRMLLVTVVETFEALVQTLLRVFVAQPASEEPQLLL